MDLAGDATGRGGGRQIFRTIPMGNVSNQYLLGFCLIGEHEWLPANNHALGVMQIQKSLF